MKNIRKILDKVFSVKTFLFLICIVAIVCVAKINDLSSKRQKKVEDRLVNFSMESYVGTNATRLEAALTECQMSYDKLEAVVIGINSGQKVEEDLSGNSDVIRYYIKDEEAVQKILNALKDMEFIEMTDDAEEFVETGIAWDVALYPEGVNYALRVYGNNSKEAGCYRTEVCAVSKGNPVMYINKFTNVWQVFGSEKQLVYDDKIERVIEEVIKEYSGKLTLDDVVNNYLGEEIDLAKLFMHTHGLLKKGKVAYESEPDMTYPTAIYQFPIEGVDGYLLLEKENWGSNFVPKVAVLRLELYNGDGECLDLSEATEEEIRAFWK